MQKKIKKVLECIKSCKLDSETRLGDLLEATLFKKQALFIDESRNVFLLASDFGNDGLLLADLISVLKGLEENHLIYVSRSNPLEGICLFYEKQTKCELTQFEGRYDIGNDQTLVLKDEAAWIEKNGNKALMGLLISDILAKEIVRYLTSVVYPTEALKEYIKRGYQTEESRLSKRANTISVVSVLIAILIAASSPFLTVWWSNTHGKSTITETQFDRLIDSISSNKVQKTDTVYIIKKDLKK